MHATMTCWVPFQHSSLIHHTSLAHRQQGSHSIAQPTALLYRIAAFITPNTHDKCSPVTGKGAEPLHIQSEAEQPHRPDIAGVSFHRHIAKPDA